MLAEIEKKVSAYLEELDQADAQEASKPDSEQRLSVEELKEKIAQLRNAKRSWKTWPKILKKEEAAGVAD